LCIEGLGVGAVVGNSRCYLPEHILIINYGCGMG
jgi:hypothetical protein